MKRVRHVTVVAHCKRPHIGAASTHVLGGFHSIFKWCCRLSAPADITSCTSVWLLMMQHDMASVLQLR